MNLPFRVGIVGTGYAAGKRVEAIRSDSRAKLLAVTGSNRQKLSEFCQLGKITAVDSWSKLVNIDELDLIFVCTVNQTCGAIALAAVEAGKHVVVEYPLALETEMAAKIVNLAARKQQLLHVEHIEIIGGLHQTLRQYLPQIGQVFHARYSTINPQQDVGQSWKYHHQMFGFPLAAALSRVHRLTDLFGEVDSVICKNRSWDIPNTNYFTACFCQVKLNFSSGVTADIIYGKGNVFYQSDRLFEIYGERGKIIVEGQRGKLVSQQGEIELPIASRRGLFALDTAMVLDYLCDRQPLYIQPEASLYALRVANAARESALIGKSIYLDRV